MNKQIIIATLFNLLICSDEFLILIDAAYEPFYNHKKDKIYVTAYTNEKPVINGDLSESIWSNISDASKTNVISDFIQDEPNNLMDPVHETHVMITYDKNNIYIAAKLYDPEPELIEREVSKRDGFNPYLSDWFSIEFDTDHDHRTGYFFAVNSSGVQSDAIIYSDTELDFEYDSIWDAAVSIEEDGWTIEIKNPFKMMSITQLKNPWGFNVTRFVYSDNEQSRWVALSRDLKGRSSHFGHLVGLTEMEINRSIDVRPYFLAGQYKYDYSYLSDPYHSQIQCKNQKLELM